MVSKIKIGFDIDSVALNYTDRFREVFKMFGGTTDLSEIKQFNYFETVREDEYKALYLTFGYMMQEILPLEDSFLTMADFMVKERGQRLQFITARQENLSYNGAKNSLYKAFENRYVMPCVMHHLISIDCVGNAGNHGSKVPKIKEYGFEYFMEDRRKNVLEISQAGVMVFMPRKSWNVLPEDTQNVMQYDDCAEVVRYLRKFHR